MDRNAHIVIVGAGLGGLAAAIQLKAAGHSNITILEAAERVGGTWAQNRYPGCCCDVPVALYQFSFAPSADWSHLFPAAAEIQAYCEHLADAHGLRPHLRLGEAATRAAWDAGRARWTVETARGARLEAAAVISALGQLNRPSRPDIPGLDTFAGPVVHSAEWDPDLDLAGRRVGVIGSAASAVQLIPEVAAIASALVVFQRTPNWVAPRGDRAISDAEKALLMTDPMAAMDLGARNRQLIFDNADTFFWQAFSWTPEGRAAYTRIALDHLAAQVPDPELRARLTPDYPVGAKRYLFSDNYLPTFLQPHVTLETASIARIDAAGVETQAGRHDLDALVLATGFETTGWHWSMEVTGRDGRRLSDVWAGGPKAYYGVTAHGFPNFFMLYGPHTNLGHNSITYMLEAQIGYALAAMEGLAGRGAAAMDVTEAAQDRFFAELQARLARTVWADPSVRSWYKNESGQITQNWGGNCREYAAALADVRWEDYLVEGAAP